MYTTIVSELKVKYLSCTAHKSTRTWWPDATITADWRLVRLCFNFTSTSHFRRGTVSILRRFARPSVPVLYGYHLQCFSRDRHLHQFPPLGPLRPPDALNFHLRRNEWIDVNCLRQANLLSHQVPFFPSDPMMNHPLLTRFQVTAGQNVPIFIKCDAGLQPSITWSRQWQDCACFVHYSPASLSRPPFLHSKCTGAMTKQRLHFLRSQWDRKLEAAYFGVFCVGRKRRREEMFKFQNKVWWYEEKSPSTAKSILTPNSENKICGFRTTTKTATEQLPMEDL